jgi:hypothetical protein
MVLVTNITKALVGFFQSSKYKDWGMLEPGLEIDTWICQRCASLKLHCGSNVTFSGGKSFTMALS